MTVARFKEANKSGHHEYLLQPPGTRSEQINKQANKEANLSELGQISLFSVLLPVVVVVVVVYSLKAGQNCY